MSREEKGSVGNKVYYTAIQGTLRTEVPSNHQDAVERKWEASGRTGVKYERILRALTGKVEGLAVYEGESDGRKFSNLNIILDANEDGKNPVVSVGVSTRYARDLMHKLPSVDFDKEIRIRPFSFIPDGETKEVIGVEILQPTKLGEFDVKVQSHYFKRTAQGKTEYINGYPIMPKPYDEMTETERKIYYLQTDAFLLEQFKKLAERLESKAVNEIDNGHIFNTPVDEINPDDIPF